MFSVSMDGIDGIAEWGKYLRMRSMTLRENSHELVRRSEELCLRCQIIRSKAMDAQGAQEALQRLGELHDRHEQGDPASQMMS